MEYKITNLMAYIKWHPHLLFMKVMIQMRLPKLFLIHLCTFVNIVNN